MKNKPVWTLIAFLFFGWLIGDDDKNQAPRTSTNVSTTPTTTQILKQSLQNEAKVTNQTKTAINAPKIKETFLYVDANRLNVRNGPGTSNKQIWTLKRDQRVATYQKEGDWVFVKGERFQGWVHGGYLTPNKAQPKQNKPQISDSQIAKQLIARSIGLYRGSCPCPYNRTRSGRRCGGNSAYSRPGGASPLCYANDITSRMISDYRSRL